MTKKSLQLAILLIASLTSNAALAECKDDELTFNFSNLEVRQAFSIFADFAKLRPQINPKVGGSEPMRFVCTHWRTAAENLARKHNLKLRIEGGVLYVDQK